MRYSKIIMKLYEAGIAMATGWTTEGCEFESWEGQEFSLLHVAQTGSGVHSVSYPMGTGGSFSRGKAARM
jgi:hypothetical protein